MTDEEQFILELLPVIKKYLTNRGIKEIDTHIDKLEQLINLASQNANPNPNPNPNPESLSCINGFDVELDIDDNSSDDNIEQFEINFEDLNQDVQENICIQLGYDHISDLIEIMGNEPLTKFYLPRN